MKERRKFRLKYLFAGILTAMMFFTLTWISAAPRAHDPDFRSLLTTYRDTIPVLKKDSLLKANRLSPDTVPVNQPGDSSKIIQKIDTFSLKLSKDTLEAPLNYEAEDSAVILFQEKKVMLFGKTKTTYKDITLTAPEVIVDQETNILTAINRKDSLGEIVENARFQQGENDFTSDTIRFNTKTQKGLTKNTFTQQGEMFVHGKDIKKVSPTTFFVSEGIFTTCDLDEPHFAFKANKIKVINNKLAVSGPTHPEFEGVPIPIYLPFGFFPLSQGRHSGFLPPQFTTNESFGLGLEGLGYYKVLNNYFDVTLRSNIYSYGGWTANLIPTYRKRYRYNGAMSLSYQHTKFNFKGDPDFAKNNSFQINWNHSVDAHARPGTSFSANVNAGSSSYNRFVPNDPQRNFQNQLSSSIQYSKSWAGKPYNLTVSANHNQNNATRLINLNLPDVGFTVNTLYPFQSKDAVGTPKWYEKLGIAYNGSFRNQVSFYDTAVKFRDLLDTFQWGAQHNIPISLSLPPILGGAVMVSPNISYSQVWIAQKLRRKWNPVTEKVDSTFTKGFFTDQTAQAGLSFSTALFGLYTFKHSKLVAIRHVIRPNFSINYKPDISKKHFYSVQVDTTKYIGRFAEYEGSLYGYYSEGRSGSLNFQIDNNLEMKVRTKDTTGTDSTKKIRLIDGFGLSSGYNFLADSLKLIPFQLYFRSTLFEKFNITANATFDPYQIDSHGNPIDKYAWQGKKFNLGRISRGNIAISTSFKSKPKDPKKEEERKKQIQQQLNDPALIGDQQRLLDYMRQNPSEFVDFNVNWDLSFSYSLNFDERLKADLSGFEKNFSSGLTFSGGFNLTEKWKLQGSGNYDFDTYKLQTFTMSISREMHCWQMSIGVTPIGLYRSFNISLHPTGAILQDLKINRTRSFTNY